MILPNLDKDKEKSFFEVARVLKEKGFVILSTFAEMSLLLAAPAAVAVRFPPGTLHGFPSLSDAAGNLLADGELEQTLDGARLRVRLRWSFRDGRTAIEEDEFEVGAHLVQRRFSWAESRGGIEQRRFTADLGARRAVAIQLGEDGKERRDEAKLDLPAGGAFAGYGTALAVSQLGLGAGSAAELGFVAFTPKPRLVVLRVSRDGEEAILAAGREIPCDRFTLHPEVGWLVRLVAHPKDAHLWFTHASPPALVRAAQNLAAKDDPVVVVDVIPRGAARDHAAGRAPTAVRRGDGSPAASRPSTP